MAVPINTCEPYPIGCNLDKMKTPILADASVAAFLKAIAYTAY